MELLLYRLPLWDRSKRPKSDLFYRDLPLFLPNPNRAGPTASPLGRHLLQPLLETH